MSAPQNTMQLQKQIQNHFKQKYPSQATVVARSLIQYFQYHQFDEWKDIQDDIDNGYDNCCCKTVLFEQLNIQNVEQKQNEYQRLKLCLNLLPSTATVFNKIHNDINKAFGTIYNQEIASNILTLFKTIVSKEFEDIESVQDDIDDADDSVIISHIIENIDYHQDSITNGIKCICLGKTNQFIAQHQKIVHDSRLKLKFEPKKRPNFDFVKDITKQIKKHFTKILDSTIAQQIAKLFNHIVKESEYADLDAIKEDIDDVENSEIIAHIIVQIDYTKHDNIVKALKHIIYGETYELLQMQSQNESHNNDNKNNQEERPKITNVAVVKDVFNIQEFEYKFDDSFVARSKKLISQLKIKYGFNDLLTTESVFVKAKAFELSIGKPIVNWLYNLYIIERADVLRSNQISDYSVLQWFNENSYANWIKQKCGNKSPEVECLISILDEFMKRAAPNFKFNDTVSDLICDSLDEFAKYAVIGYNLANVFINNIQDGTIECAPIQIDFTIIPQAIKRAKLKAISANKQTLAHFLPDEDDENEQEQKSAQNKDEYKWQLGKSIDHSKCRNPIWFIDDHLEMFLYKKGKDYLVEDAGENVFVIRQQMYKMWEKLNGRHDQRHKRYIIIVDRRNPVNLQRGKQFQSNDNFVPPVIDNNKIWKDKIYFIKPKEYGNIPHEWEIQSEALFGLSKQYILPDNDKGGIGMIGSWAGYKWGFSYHLISANKAKVYWYYRGLKIFQLSDIISLWPKLFVDINGQKQKVNNHHLGMINDYEKDKKLPDDAFHEFKKQANAMKNRDPMQFFLNGLVDALTKEYGEIFAINFKELFMNAIRTLNAPHSRSIKRNRFATVDDIIQDLKDKKSGQIFKYLNIVGRKTKILQIVNHVIETLKKM